MAYRPRRIPVSTVVTTAAAMAIAGTALGDGPPGTRAPGPPRGPGQTQVPSTPDDFFQPGTQPLPSGYQELIVSRFNCINCHKFEDDDNPDEVVPPYDNWVTSLMAQSARDPVWLAALAIANQDAAGSGETCVRCHSPVAWFGGRSGPGDTSVFIDDDYDGVNCNFCHRVVDPIWNAENPAEDIPILKDLVADGTYPEMPGNSRSILDPTDVRRGPLDDIIVNMHSAPILVSPFHEESAFCGTCHDVANPMFSRQADGSFSLNALGAGHPTQDIHEMMPEQTTYSEWLNSDFANGGVAFPDGRFGGQHPTGLMRSCQDCHMPKHSGGMCVFWDLPEVGTRPYASEHSFTGGNTWVLSAIRSLFPDNETGLSDAGVQMARDRTVTLLQAASDMDLTLVDEVLTVRVTNMSGHKLPTGYPEGRRMWLNIRFLDEEGDLLEERGAYDHDTATLTTTDTKVWEVAYGMTAAMAELTGLPEGESFHLVLNDEIVRDNRIPPMGFTNEAFASFNAQPTPPTYADGQHWDDTAFAVPFGTAHIIATCWFQTSSREYIEFLRDTNVTNDDGQIVWDVWNTHGRSAPVAMDSAVIDLLPWEDEPDVNGDGVVDLLDLLAVLGAWGPCEGCSEDTNHDDVVDVLDILVILAYWD